MRAGLTWDGDPRVKPPYGAAEIDWGHRLSRNLGLCLLLNEQGGIPRDRAWTLNGSGAGGPWVHTATGPARNYNSNTVHTQFPSSAVLQAGANISSNLILVPNVTLTTTANTHRAGNKNTEWWWLQGNGASLGTGGMNWDTQNNTGTHQVASLGEAINAGVVTHLTGLTDVAGFGVRVYRDGVLKGTTAWSGGNPPASSNVVTVGNSNALATHVDSAIVLLQFWQRTLSADEVLELHTEPYAMLRPRSPIGKYWFIPVSIETVEKDFAEALRAGLSEYGDALVSLALSDEARAGLLESRSDDDQLDLTEGLPAGLSEYGDLRAGLQEVGAFDNDLDLTEALRAGLQDVGAVLVTFGVPDSLRAGLTEQPEIVVVVDASESLRAALSEYGDLLARLDLTDEGRAGLQDAPDLRADQWLTEALRAALSEGPDQVTTVDASDTLRAGLADVIAALDITGAGLGDVLVAVVEILAARRVEILANARAVEKL